MDPRLRSAVDASVGWYADVCASHGIPAVVDGGLWRTASPPPALHTEFVVVEPDVTSDQVIAAVKDGHGGGVKDSFATLDLSPIGMRVLFSATWIHHPRTEPSRRILPPGWTLVTSPAELAEWNAAHDTAGVLLPGLLELGTFRFLARRSRGRITAGLVARLGSGTVDVSNVHAAEGHAFHWHELVSAVRACFPGRDLVGYENGPDLDDALAAGFDPVGDLRIWVT